MQTPRAQLGQPCQALASSYYARIIKAADVKRIKFHGMRHTSATLALATGAAVQVVSQRLGHADASTTLNVYSHATPDLQELASSRINAVLYG